MKDTKDGCETSKSIGLKLLARRSVCFVSAGMLIVLLKISKLENKLAKTMMRTEDLIIQKRESKETIILIGWLLTNEDFGLSVSTWRELGTWRLSDIHHPDIHHLGHSSPQTFITPYLKSDIHHLGHSSPQTFITSDIHHPLAKIRCSSPQTFITSNIHHLRHSSPKTFITPLLNSDIHHLRHSSPPSLKTDIHHLRLSSPQTFITPYLKSDIHHLRHSSPPYWIHPYWITSDIHHPPP